MYSGVEGICVCGRGYVGTGMCVEGKKMAVHLKKERKGRCVSVERIEDVGGGRGLGYVCSGMEGGVGVCGGEEIAV